MQEAPRLTGKQFSLRYTLPLWDTLACFFKKDQKRTTTWAFKVLCVGGSSAWENSSLQKCLLKGWPDCGVWKVKGNEWIKSLFNLQILKQSRWLFTLCRVQGVKLPRAPEIHRPGFICADTKQLWQKFDSKRFHQIEKPGRLQAGAVSSATK